MDKIDLSGGEPTIYKHIEYLICFCEVLGFKEIRLVTNGTQWKYALALSINHPKLRFSVSLHSHIKSDMISLVGTDIFDKVVSFINFLRHRINYVNCVPSPHNTDIKNLALGIYEIVNPNDELIKPITICIKHLDYNFSHNCGDFKRETYKKELNESVRNLYSKYPNARVDMRFFPFCFLVKDLRHNSNVKMCSANTNVFDPLDWNPAIGRKTPLSRYIKLIFGTYTMRLKASQEQASIQSKRECTRTKKCSTCSLNKVCDGCQNGYLKIFGDDELNPQ